MTNAYVPVPRTQATNAYDLITEIIQLIEEEPRRLDMSAWLRTGDDLPHEEDRVPACGTIGCFAGWVTILTRPLELPRLEADRVEDLDFSVADCATEALLGPRPLPPAAPEAFDERFDPSDAETFDKKSSTWKQRPLTDEEQANIAAWVAYDRAFREWQIDCRPFNALRRTFAAHGFGAAGTHKHVLYTVRVIREFQEEYASLLQARPVSPWAVTEFQMLVLRDEE